MALRHKEVNGGAGQVVDVALYEAVFAMMESLVPEFDVFGFVRERTGNIMPGITPSNTHTTRDGRHITIGANGDAIFRRLMRAMGRDDLAEDPTRSPTTPAATLVAASGVVRADRRLGGAADDRPCWPRWPPPRCRPRASTRWPTCSPTRNSWRARCALGEAADRRDCCMPGVVPKLSGARRQQWIGPALGEHTDAVLAGLGCGPIAALRAAGAI